MTSAAGAPTQGRLVSEQLATGTPHVLDGRVYSVVQVGDTIVLGGTFTRVREAGSSRVLVRRGLVAFDAGTGRIDTHFRPDPRGDVRVVLPAADGRSVYVGGAFTSIARRPRAKLARVRLRDGRLVASFTPGRVTGQVKDLALVRGRLWVAGAFTHVAGHPQQALATVGPATGRWTGFMSVPVRGRQNGGVTQVLKIVATPDGSRLVAIGNFDRVGGGLRHQLAVLDLAGRRAALSRWHTRFYTPTCSRRFDTYLRDVDVSPDGAYVVVGTTGGYAGSTGPCDTVARFELRRTGGAAVPSWVDATGGDTTTAVEVTDSAVYVGGHQRWWNNPYRGDRAGPGAVPRPGVAALDPLNGLPFAWNPGRDRGVGVFDFLATSAGLWVASDTTRIGDQVKGRIARFLPEGRATSAARAARLPGDVYLAGSGGTGLRRRTFDGRTAGRAVAVPSGGLDWGTVRGAFILDGRLYLAQTGGRFTSRCFDGSRLGAATTVDTADRLVRLREWAADLARATGMFFDQGRLYYTLAGSSRLHYRYFAPHSGVVGAQRLVGRAAAGGLRPAQVKGMFLSGSTLYWATADGVLHSVGWRRGWPAGAPVGRARRTWGGDGTEVSWSSRAAFIVPTSHGGCST